jgi:CubicO group peptidase (beta-lactamase class C family)
MITCKNHRTNNQYEPIADLIQNVLNPLIESGKFSGTILVAGRSGIAFQKAFGLADRTIGRQMQIETPFYLASVSKQFTAAAVMLLYQDGLIAFDDPITKYLVELPEPIYGEVTLRHMLHHTSGIPDYYNFANPASGFTNDDVYTILQEIDSLLFKPGEKYQYSNSGYVLLSILVGKVSGKSFAEFVHERIIEPLNMNHCTVKDEFATEIRNPAIGYDASGNVSDYRFFTTGGGGFFASVMDLYLWDRALYTGKILDLELLKEEAWRSGVLHDGKLINYGFGWNLNPKHPEIVRHGGDLQGFRTHFFRDTKRKIAIIILSNSGYDEVSGMCDKIYRVIRTN